MRNHIMTGRLLLSLSLAALVAACGKPAPEQAAPQWPGALGNPDTAAAAKAAAIAATPPVAGAPPVSAAMPAPGVSPEYPADRSTAEQRAAATAAAQKAGLPVNAETRGSWACDNGETIDLRVFPDQGVAVLVRGGENTELQQQPVGSGFKFSNDQTIVQGKGEELTLNVGMMATTACKPA